MELYKRGRIWWGRRRVPTRFKSIETKERFAVSLGTEAEAEARLRATLIWAQQVGEWERAMTGSESEKPHDRFRRISAEAIRRGFGYYTHKELVTGPLERFLERIEEVAKIRTPSPIDYAVYFGGEDYPKIKASEIFEPFKRLRLLDLNGKDRNQQRVWRNAYIKAINNLIVVVGDKPILEYTPRDVKRFKDWWLDRVLDEGVKSGTPNKDFMHLRVMFSTVLADEGVKDPNIWEKVRIKGNDKGERPPFSTEWIMKHLLCPNPLPELNEEARDILLVMVNTGCRPSEIIGLLPEHIKLDAPIPHIQIRAVGRQVKTKASVRDVVLYGVALDAMRRHPQGFSRYRGKGSSWSNLVGDYFEDHKLIEREGQTAYSLRHSFEDRMTAKLFPDRLCADLMGHATKRPRYGDGASLELKLAAIKQIALFAAA